jgi:hypothetical protein|tara:strand:- start:1215 stop:1562 length:348 start_codon:yes stop_codon:yes gene_type:complete
MGLDQYAFIRLETKDVDGNFETEELATWRKHSSLHGFMEEHYYGDKEFNCIDLEITEDDIDELEEAVNAGDLPATKGFFFGDDSSKYYKEADLEFCANARKALEDGQEVFYSSWW